MEQSLLNTLEYTDGDFYVNDLTIVLDKLDPDYLKELVARFPKPVAIVLADSIESVHAHIDTGITVNKPIGSYEASGIINSSSDYSLIADEDLKKKICKELIGSLHDMVMKAPLPAVDFDYEDTLFVICSAPLLGPIEYSLCYVPSKL